MDRERKNRKSNKVEKRMEEMKTYRESVETKIPDKSECISVAPIELLSPDKQEESEIV